jgi:hypothetical protein
MLSVLISNTGDLITTMIGLHLGAFETNQAIYPYGLQIFFLFKILFPTSAVIIASLLNEYIESYGNKAAMWSIRLIRLTALFVTLGFTYAVINNIGVILHILGI